MIGTLTPLMGQGILGSCRFGVFEYVKKRIASFKAKKISDLEFFERAIAAFCAGLATSFFLVSVNLN